MLVAAERCLEMAQRSERERKWNAEIVERERQEIEARAAAACAEENKCTERELDAIERDFLREVEAAEVHALEEDGNHQIRGVKVDGFVKDCGVSGHGACESRPGPRPPPPIDPTDFGGSQHAYAHSDLTSKRHTSREQWAAPFQGSGAGDGTTLT